MENTSEINSPPILQKSLELARALYPAKEDQEMRTWHLTLIWNKNRLLVAAENRKKTTPRNLRNKKYNREGVDISSEKYSCSEYRAWRKLGKQRDNVDFAKLTMVNIRFDRNGNIGIAAPCLSCSSLLRYLSPRRVFFTNNEGKFEQYHI